MEHADVERMSILAGTYAAAGRIQLAVAAAAEAAELAQAAGDAETAAELRRWVNKHQDHASTPQTR
jgi:hypothetical protein